MAMWEYDRLIAETTNDLYNELAEKEADGWELVNFAPRRFEVTDTSWIKKDQSGASFVAVYEASDYCAFVRRRKQ